jgi:hypothetical protein
VCYPAKSSNAPDAPITIYHNGVVSLPVADSYASNPIASVSDNVDCFGSADVNATTVDIDQTRLADGRLYNTLDTFSSNCPSGFVYLGKYTNVSRVVITANAASGSVIFDTVKLRIAVEQPRSRMSARLYGIDYTCGGTDIHTNDDFKGAYSIVDLEGLQLLDHYSDETTPAILDSNIRDFDVVG